MSFLSGAFGRALQTALNRRGMKQAALIEPLKVAQNTVSRWISGEFIPGNDKLDLLPEALGIKPEEFLELMAGLESKPTATQTAMAQTIGLLQSELDEVKSHPFYPYIEKGLSQQQIDFVVSYLDGKGLERARQLLEDSKNQAESNTQKPQAHQRAKR